MKLNKAQQKALLALYDRKRSDRKECGSYLAFRRQVKPLFMEPNVATITIFGIFVGIEPDGYTHS